MLEIFALNNEVYIEELTDAAVDEYFAEFNPKDILTNCRNITVYNTNKNITTIRPNNFFIFMSYKNLQTNKKSNKYWLMELVNKNTIYMANIMFYQTSDENLLSKYLFKKISI